MASTKTLVFNAVASRQSFMKDQQALIDHCKANRIGADTLRPVVMEGVSAYYKVTILQMENGKEKLDSEAANYEAARKCMQRIMLAAYSKGGKDKGNSNADPVKSIVARITARVEKKEMTKAQVRRLIAALNNLL